MVLSSARLGTLFKHLKSNVPSWIFRNTEVLRGYLRGMFDGDGSVTGVDGKIMLVQGGKTSWVFMRKIQEALLLFGIRSRLRHYNYGHRCFHLQVSTKDNHIFAEKIGFINSTKQGKLKYGVKKYGESVYRTEKVSFAHITEEKIDMYDIVNSESGRYMANGLVTHNTAAYVIKHAMKRCDERIRKERWVGKVDMVLQVHY